MTKSLRLTINTFFPVLNFRPLSVWFLGLLFIGLMGITEAEARSLSTGKKALNQIEELKVRHYKKIESVDHRIQKSLNAGGKEDVADLESLRKLRREYVKRLDLFDRLQLGIESHFKGGELKEFLVGYLLSLSEIEIKNNPTQNDQLWKAAIFLSQALSKISERFEDPIEFIAAYIDFSSIGHPQPPQAFIAQRNYTNGRDYESANPVSAADLKRQAPNILPKVEIRASVKVTD